MATPSIYLFTGRFHPVTLARLVVLLVAAALARRVVLFFPDPNQPLGQLSSFSALAHRLYTAPPCLTLCGFTKAFSVVVTEMSPSDQVSAQRVAHGLSMGVCADIGYNENRSRA